MKDIRPTNHATNAWHMALEPFCGGFSHEFFPRSLRQGRWCEKPTNDAQRLHGGCPSQHGCVNTKSGGTPHFRKDPSSGWLVVGFNHLEKWWSESQWVSDDIHSYDMENNPAMCWNHQPGGIIC